MTDPYPNGDHPPAPLLVADWIDPTTGDTLPAQSPVFPPWWKTVRTAVRDNGGSVPGTLIALVVRAAALIPPEYVLPAIVGTAVSPINLFGMIIGAPGGGKSGGWHTATELLPPHEQLAPANDGVVGVSGAGIIRRYLRPKKPAPGWECDPELRSAVFVYDESESFQTKLSAKSAGGDLSAVLRTAWSGATISTAGGSAETTRFVPGGWYRTCVMALLQPDVAVPALRNRGTGMAQRILAAPAADTDDIQKTIARLTAAANNNHPPPAEPEPLPELSFRPPPQTEYEPDQTLRRYPIQIPADIRAEIVRYHQAHRTAEQYDHLPEPARIAADTELEQTIYSDYYRRIDHGEHTQLLRLRTAAALAALRYGTTDTPATDRPLSHPLITHGITDNDWKLAGTIMSVSAAAWSDYDHHQTDIRQTTLRLDDIRNAERAAIETKHRLTAEIDIRLKIIQNCVTAAERIYTRMTANGDTPTIGDIWRELPGRRRKTLRTDPTGREQWEQSVYDLIPALRPDHEPAPPPPAPAE